MSEGVGPHLARADPHTCSTGTTQILPSPILPVRAAEAIASTTAWAWSSSHSTSTLIFGTKSTWYSAPR